MNRSRSEVSEPGLRSVVGGSVYIKPIVIPIIPPQDDDDVYRPPTSDSLESNPPQDADDVYRPA